MGKNYFHSLARLYSFSAQHILVITLGTCPRLQVYPSHLPGILLSTQTLQLSIIFGTHLARALLDTLTRLFVLPSTAESNKAGFDVCHGHVDAATATATRWRIPHRPFNMHKNRKGFFMNNSDGYDWMCHGN